MTQQQRLKTQVLVIGAGISGSTSALTLADAGYEVTLIVPGKELDGGNSALAQGGIVYRSDPNDAKDLEKDILVAGHHHNYVKAVRHLCQHGPEAVERILMERAPIPFDRLDGKLDFTREGGHGKHRIVHCADHTGKTIMEGLLQAVRMSPNIRILTGRTAVDLITTDHHARYKEYRYQLDNQCLGAYVYNEDTREVETLLADFTVLATGGVGQVYLHTTNTAACTVPSTTCAPFPAISTTSTKIRPSPSPSWIFSTAARRPTASPRVPCATPAASGAITGSTRAERIAGKGNLFFREVPLSRTRL